MPPLTLPSAEYKVTLTDGTITHVSVHPDESLEAAIRDMLASAGADPAEVAAVAFERTFDLAEAGVS